MYGNKFAPNFSSYKKIHMIKQTQKYVDSYKNLLKERTKNSLKKKLGLKPIDIGTFNKKDSMVNQSKLNKINETFDKTIEKSLDMEMSDPLGLISPGVSDKKLPLLAINDDGEVSSDSDEK